MRRPRPLTVRPSANAWWIAFAFGGIAACGGGAKAPVAKPIASAAPPVVDKPRVVSAAPAPLRRLTREEYDHTVRDLLGDTTHPAQAFSPDEAASGFESNDGVPVTAALVERYMDAAESLAAAAVARIDVVAPCPASEPRDACAARFITTFGRRAFRRPLSEGEHASLVSLYTDKAAQSDYAGGIRIVLEAMLQSPQFLYRLEPHAGASAGVRRLDGWELATRLSFFLWASTPDDALLDEAAAGSLDTREGLERAVRRMMRDARAEDGVRSFHRQWLGLKNLELVSKDSLAVKFTPELKRSMVEETLRFSTAAVDAGGDTIETLLTSSASFVDGPLADLYGVPRPREGFSRVELPPGQRSGLLTQASVMARLASGDETSPVTRGKFVREKLLCDVMSPPPPNVAITPPKVDPTLPTKERFRRHRTDTMCSGCHALMDPIGFGFEHYDGVGAWRTADGAFPIDATGDVTGLDGSDVAFDGAVDLGARLARSPQVRRCIATQWFRFAVGRNERPEDTPSIDASYGVFQGAGFDVRELIVALATSDAFTHVLVEEGSER